MNLPAPHIRWPLGIAAILGATIAGNVAVMRVAGDDPSFAVEPDYYRRAVAWDTTMAQARASAALGWRVTPAVAPLVAGAPATVTLAITDRDGAPLTGATVAVEALFNARANDRHTATMAEVAPGRYAAPLPLAWAGEWELRVQVRRGHAPPQAFHAVERVTVVRGRG
jgi:nitrogen fixation protein FixH